MAQELFNTCHREVYPNLPLEYSDESDLIKHSAGRALEGYLRNRFRDLRRSPAAEQALKNSFMASYNQPTSCVQRR